MSLKTFEVVKHKQRLDSLFGKAASLPKEPELLANWAKYLCVLVSGFIEESVRTLMLKYVQSRATLEIQDFVGKQLRE